MMGKVKYSHADVFFFSASKHSLVGREVLLSSAQYIVSVCSSQLQAVVKVSFSGL